MVKITMSVSESEKQELERIAAAAGKTVSNYIREKIQLKAVKIGRPAVRHKEE